MSQIKLQWKTNQQNRPYGGLEDQVEELDLSIKVKGNF